MFNKTPIRLNAFVIFIGLLFLAVQALQATELPESQRFQLRDMFDLEVAADPQISPDGSKVVFVRSFSDIMKDRNRASLWIVNHDGTDLRALGTGNGAEQSPRWSPDGKRLLYVATADGSTQLYVRWMDSGQSARLTHVQHAPSSIEWSADGRWIAFAMDVPDETKPFVTLPAKPEGAEWAKPAKAIQRMIYRTDEAGYLEEAHTQIFVLPAEGGTPRQLTRGPYDHGGALQWTPDGKSIIFSGNIKEDWEYDPIESEIHVVAISDGSIQTLTARDGPDFSPALSPDGKRIAYLGFDDHLQGYEITRLYVMNRDGSDARVVTANLDRDVQTPVWSDDSRGIYFQYDEHGNTRIAHTSVDGKVEDLARDVGGVSHGRPYGGGSFSVAADGRFAYTQTRPDHPADIATGRKGSNKVTRATRLNDDLFAFRQLGAVEEIWTESSLDQRRIQGWIVKPPGFEAGRKYPLILEIHGGPFADYGDRFSSEIQLFAAAGYVVLYANPRGSTSYGQEFGNLIHHDYPNHDYDDLMSMVDAAIARGYVDADNLFVTGGSGGGTLTAWIVGKTTRFRAAVAAKPVINWYSFVLVADNPVFFYRYWFPGLPWDNLEHYMKRSPISLVGNVKTPTMVLTGEVDYRTPMSESEQYYEALKLNKVDTALVRIPDAAHGMDGRPSYLVSKVAHILKWFEMHRLKKEN